MRDFEDAAGFLGEHRVSIGPPNQQRPDCSEQAKFSLHFDLPPVQLRRAHKPAVTSRLLVWRAPPVGGNTRDTIYHPSDNRDSASETPERFMAPAKRIRLLVEPDVFHAGAVGD